MLIAKAIGLVAGILFLIWFTGGLAEVSAEQRKAIWAVAAFFLLLMVAAYAYVFGKDAWDRRQRKKRIEHSPSPRTAHNQGGLYGE